jgi:hypothetical protein
LDAVCFKLFKAAFRKEKYTPMVKRNYTKLSNKITLARWVNKALDLTLTRKNIMLGFKGTRIWPFNPRAMDSKIGFSILYTLQNQAREEEESEQEDGEQD